MEQAHIQLIAQLNERISAADNTPLYLKFAQTVKNAVRSGILEHGNILHGERYLSQLTGVSRITVRKAMQALEEEGVVTRARGYGTQINNIFEYSLKEARGFSAGGVTRKNQIRCGSINAWCRVRKRWRSSWRLPLAVTSSCLNVFAMWMKTPYPLKSPGSLRILFMMWMPSASRCTTIFAASIFSAAHALPRQRPHAGCGVPVAHSDGQQSAGVGDQAGRA